MPAAFFYRFLLFTGLLAGSVALAVPAEPAWQTAELANPRQVKLGGPVGASLQRSLDRLAQPPYTTDWLLSDVSFKVNRIFTNYSGDVSGRFLELASLTSEPGHLSPPTLGPVMRAIAGYQKPDGHFGLDMDFGQPMQKLSPPIPMLWGNARLLVGLVTAATELNDTNLLAAARRLGDFYVATTNVFCSSAREAELRATGSGGDGYTCCYFPGIEGLAMLYRATHDKSYLDQARLMAEWFKKFDALPVDHSHGNLCAWRGILMLYEITGDQSYLDRALTKWEKAVQDGYVWTLGGVGEHWYRNHVGDEGCSESDWLRFNLDLWRFTGETRFLDMAERLLLNQYAGNQCPNGGYGWRPFDGDPEGPVGTTGNLDEWYFCCSFHGPLGLHFLKTYLAAGSGAGVFVNFPLDFTSTVKSGGRDWQVAVRPASKGSSDRREFEVELSPVSNQGKTRAAATTLWLRRPEWATQVKVTTTSGSRIPFSIESGYVRLDRKFGAGERVRVSFQTGLRLERRRFQTVTLPPAASTTGARLLAVSLLNGPEVLFATPAPSEARLTLLARRDADGNLALWKTPEGSWVTVAVPDLTAGAEQIRAALERGRILLLRPESELRTHRRAAFVHDVLVVPDDLLPRDAVARFTERARQGEAQTTPASPFGEHLELNPDIWLAGSGWTFGTNSLRITGGDVGLLDGQPGGDYRFAFDFELPVEGEGISGWVVRAQGTGDCVLFQLQSADSPYRAPEFKTQPNTLRPHIRRFGEWVIADPVPLPEPVRRGETYHIAVDCHGPEITVYLDGAKIYTGSDGGYASGTVGFRAVSPTEQAIFRNVSLQKR